MTQNRKPKYKNKLQKKPVKQQQENLFIHVNFITIHIHIICNSATTKNKKQKTKKQGEAFIIILMYFYNNWYDILCKPFYTIYHFVVK